MSLEAETTGPGSPVATRPAATLVLLRPPVDAGAGFEVLLTKRPDSMRFGPGMYVFPGGRLEAGERAVDAAVRETAEETGIEVAAAALTPISRWVTPFGLPARFDARFFAAVVPAGTDVARGSDEVAAWSWLRPADALAGMAAGRLPMWQPTVVTLQQLEAAADEADLASAFGPDPSPIAREAAAASGRTFATGWAGGIEGRHGLTRVLGTRAWVVVNPPDPTDGTVTSILEAASAADATIAGVLIEDLEPDHHAGVEMFARGLGLPVVGPPGADGCAPYAVRELSAGAPVPFGDLSLKVAVVAGPRSNGRWAERAGRLRLIGA